MSLAYAAEAKPFRIDTDRFARCIATSKRVRWDIDADVIRGRRFDLAHKFLPDGLSKVTELDFLSEAEQRYLSQVQGRTYANMFGLVERFVGAKVLELTRDHWLGDQVALEALIRFGDEELKHQELFRRIERMVGETMADGYVFDWNPNEVAALVLGKCTWAVMGLTLHIELFSQAHYRQSIEPDASLSPLFKDVMLYHWREESQHAILDELEWRRINAGVSVAEREAAVDEFIELVEAVDAILLVQAGADCAYFFKTCGRPIDPAEQSATQEVVLAAYRWQYILSGAEHPHFLAVLDDLATLSQQKRIAAALAPLA
jgi:hypothetical protein